MGTLFVHHGYTLYTFSKYDFAVDMKTFIGPLSDFWDGFDIYGGWCFPGLFCVVPSMIIECGMKMPDCQPSDEKNPVAFLDNSGLSLPSKFTYKYQVETEWFSEILQGFNIDYSVTAKIKASFFGLFEAEASLSFSADYNWQNTSSESKSKVSTYTFKLKFHLAKYLRLSRARVFVAIQGLRPRCSRIWTKKTGVTKIFHH